MHATCIHTYMQRGQSTCTQPHNIPQVMFPTARHIYTYPSRPPPLRSKLASLDRNKPKKNKIKVDEMCYTKKVRRPRCIFNAYQATTYFSRLHSIYCRGNKATIGQLECAQRRCSDSQYFQRRLAGCVVQHAAGHRKLACLVAQQGPLSSDLSGKVRKRSEKSSKNMLLTNNQWNEEDFSVRNITKLRIQHFRARKENQRRKE